MQKNILKTLFLLVDLFLIYFSFFSAWKIRFLKRDRLTDDSIKKKLQLGWGFNRFFDRYVAQSKLLSGRTLQDGFEVLYEADLALKTSLFKPEIIMRHLLYELCVDRT